MSRSGGITWFVAVALSAALAGCGDERPPADAATPSGRTAATLVDSLVLTAGGAEVWFTDGRAAQDSLGVACSERVLEIRTARDTVAVPLLYTGEAPTLENDSTLWATVWLEVVALALHRITRQQWQPDSPHTRQTLEAAWAAIAGPGDAAQDQPPPGGPA